MIFDDYPGESGNKGELNSPYATGSNLPIHSGREGSGKMTSLSHVFHAATSSIRGAI